MSMRSAKRAHSRANPDGGEHPSLPYQRVERAARADLDRAVQGLAGAERKVAMRTARATYDRVTDAAWDTFQRAVGNRMNPGKMVKRNPTDPAFHIWYRGTRTVSPDGVWEAIFIDNRPGHKGGYTVHRRSDKLSLHPSGVVKESKGHLFPHNGSAILKAVAAYESRTAAKRNPITAPIGYTGDALEGHAIPWSREGHKRIRAAVGRIDRAKTHAEMYKAHTDANRVRESLNRKGLGAGQGFPHEWGNDIGSSYMAKYAELGPTEEDVRDAARNAALATEKERARAKRKLGGNRNNPRAVAPGFAVWRGDYYKVSPDGRWIADPVGDHPQYRGGYTLFLRAAPNATLRPDGTWRHLGEDRPWKNSHVFGNNYVFPRDGALLIKAIAAYEKRQHAAAAKRVNPDDAREWGPENLNVGERVRVQTGDYFDQRSKRQIRHDGLYVVGVVASVTKRGQYNVDLLNGHQLRARASAVSRTKRDLTPAVPVRKSGLLLNPDLVGVLRTAPGPTYAVAWEVRSGGRVIRRGTAADASAARDDVEHEGVPRRAVMWDNGSGRLVAAP